MKSFPGLELSRKLKFLSLENLGDVEVEEVAVEDSLDAAGNDGNDVVESFKVVSVDPVEDVESAIDSKGEEIVGGDGFGFPGLLDHEQLGQDGHRLQVDGKCPEDFHQGEFVVQEQRQDDTGQDQELNSEGIMVGVIGGLELEVHEVAGADGRGKEEHLHGRVVGRDEVGEQVQVTGDEHQGEQDLRPA